MGAAWLLLQEDSALWLNAIIVTTEIVVFISARAAVSLKGYNISANSPSYTPNIPPQVYHIHIPKEQE